MYPSTCISHWNPSIHINTAFLITKKQANNKSFFQKIQLHNAVHVLSDLMVINKTYWEQDQCLKSQNPACLCFFSNNSELYNILFHLNNVERLQNQDFVFSFFELVTRNKNVYLSTLFLSFFQVSHWKVKK